MQFMQAAGSAMQVIGTLTAGENASSIANRNADALNQQAAETRRASNVQEGMLRSRNALQASSRRTAMLQNGIDPASGTALIDSEQMARDAELDALTLRYEGLMKARGIDMEADQQRWQGQAKKRQGYFSAASQLVGGATNYLNASGFGRLGPGYSGQQAPAPVETRIPKLTGR